VPVAPVPRAWISVVSVNPARRRSRRRLPHRSPRLYSGSTDWASRNDFDEHASAAISITVQFDLDLVPAARDAGGGDHATARATWVQQPLTRFDGLQKVNPATRRSWCRDDLGRSSAHHRRGFELADEDAPGQRLARWKA